MTHVLRCINRLDSALHEKEVIEATTVIETPPMRVVGIVGYIKTVKGMRTLTTLWAKSLSQSFLRRFYKNWYKSKKKAFSKYKANASDEQTQTIKDRMVKYCQVIRLICHTQPEKLNNKD